jgi:hypothetical protein
MGTNFPHCALKTTRGFEGPGGWGACERLWKAACGYRFLGGGGHGGRKEPQGAKSKKAKRACEESQVVKVGMHDAVGATGVAGGCRSCGGHRRL